MTPPTREIIRVFARIGVMSFGGPAAQIAVMHRELVQERSWLSEQHFLSALSFCMLLPGPEAMQLATYSGWRLRGVTGGLIAGLLFVLPGALVIAALALLYARFGTNPQTTVLLLGIKATVIVIVVQALIRLTAKGLTGAHMVWIAALAFVAIFAFQVPFPLLILAAAAFGFATSAPTSEVPRAKIPKPHLPTIALWTGLWLAPLPVLYALGETLLFDLAAFFAKLAVVTFGGAYAVLAYMAQEVVQTRGWLDAAQMIDALGLAEATPGPLILVTQFVGMLTGHTAGGAAMALIAGALTLWMTFVPCFLWIFAFAPFIEHLRARPRLKGALAAITAAVIGVILNLSLWFAMHVVFADVVTQDIGPAALALPDWSTLRPEALVLIALAGALILGLKRGPLLTLALVALASWAVSAL